MYAYSSINMSDANTKVEYKHYAGGGLHSLVFDCDGKTIHLVLDTPELARLHYEIEGSLRHAHEEENADSSTK